jgi:hypothetical protein
VFDDVVTLVMMTEDDNALAKLETGFLNSLGELVVGHDEVIF